VRTTSQWWAQVGTLVGAMAAIATIHAVVIVPSILDASAVRAAEIAKREADGVRQALNAHLADVETIRASLATRGEVEQLSRAIDRIAAQLDRIEAK